MRRLTVALLVLIVLPAVVWAAALPFTPSLVMTRASTTTMRLQLSGFRATDIDTIKVYPAGDDSLTGPKFWFNAAASIDTTVGGLTPGVTYIWKARADSAGTYKTSVPDTAQTYFPQVEFPTPTTIMDDWRSAARATAWPPSNTYTYGWTLRTATGTDSSMVYEVWPYTGSMVVVTGDSVKFQIWLYGGFNDTTGQPYFALVDSATYTVKGTFAKTWSIPVGCRQFYYRLMGFAGNGNTTGISIFTRRSRH